MAAPTKNWIGSVEVRPGNPQRLLTTVLPKGTLLFRATRLRGSDEDPYGMDLFQDFLGHPVGDTFCLSPIHNVFCFPIPYPCLGIYDWTSESEAWKKYNAIMVYSLNEDYPFVTLISPAKEVRGSPKGFGAPGDIISRCDKFPPTSCFRGRPNESTRTEAFQKAQAWDNCINPVRRIDENLGGWIAVAEADSIDVFVGKGRAARRVRPRLTPMGKYLTTLAGADLVDTLPHLVVDARGTRGFPEIVVNPRSALSGLTDTLNRKTTSFKETTEMVAEDFRSGHLAFSPVATITASGFYFFEGSGFNLKRENTGKSSGTPYKGMSAEERRSRIEQNCYELMSRLGKGELSGLPAATFDRRTGFFVLGGAGMDGRMSLRTAADWSAIRSYCVRIKGGHPGSEYLFQRPPSIISVIRDLEIPYSRNTGISRAAKDLIGMEGDSSRRALGGTRAVLQKSNKLRKNTRQTRQTRRTRRTTRKGSC